MMLKTFDGAIIGLSAEKPFYSWRTRFETFTNCLLLETTHYSDH
jgi:hypothetical protein